MSGETARRAEYANVRATGLKIEQKSWNIYLPFAVHQYYRGSPSSPPPPRSITTSSPAPCGSFITFFITFPIAVCHYFIHSHELADCC